MIEHNGVKYEKTFTGSSAEYDSIEYHVFANFDEESYVVVKRNGGKEYEVVYETSNYRDCFNKADEFEVAYRKR